MYFRDGNSPIRIHIVRMLVVTALFGCTQSNDDTAHWERTSASQASRPVQTLQTTQPDRVTPRNVLFVVIDAATARRMSLYGYEVRTTPFIDSLATESVVFTSAYSQGTLTITSAWSYLTGKYPYLPEDGKYGEYLRPTDNPLPELFQNAGFATGGFSENPFLSEDFGFDAGFDDFTYLTYREPSETSSDVREEMTPEERFLENYVNYWRIPNRSQTLVEEVKRWISQTGESRWFCYVHVLRPHNPYYVPDPDLLAEYVDVKPPPDQELHKYLKDIEYIVLTQAYAGASLPGDEKIHVLEQLYNANMARADGLIRQLIEFLDAGGMLEQTLVIILSDHGESFGEHGKLLHGTEPYEELIHVPLLIRPPAGFDWSRRRIGTPVELIDVTATLVELYGFEPEHELDGQSLLTALEGRMAPPKSYLVSEIFELNSLSIREGDSKLLLKLGADRTTVYEIELYDLAADANEETNLAAQSPHTARLLSLATTYLQTHSRGKAGAAREIDPEKLKALKALGYLHVE